MSWYYELNNEQQGPVSEEELRSMIEQASIPPGSRVWTKGMSDWQEYETVFAEHAAAEDTEELAESLSEGEPSLDAETLSLDESVEAETETATTVEPEMIAGRRSTASELRERARKILTGNLGPCVGGVALFGIISAVMSSLPLGWSLLQYAVSGPLTLALAVMFLKLNRTESVVIGDFFNGVNQSLKAIGAYFVVTIIGFIAAIFGGILGAGIIWGLNLALPEAIPISIQPETIQSPMAILWLIPALIAMFYAQLRYGLTFFIIADEDLDLGVYDSIKRSGDYMTGNMLKLLWLGLTFTGWYILGALCFFVGLIWSHTYFMAAFAAFYDEVKLEGSEKTGG